VTFEGGCATCDSGTYPDDYQRFCVTAVFSDGPVPCHWNEVEVNDGMGNFYCSPCPEYTKSQVGG